MVIVRRILGYILILSALVLGLNSFWNWYEGKSSAQDLTEEEVKQYIDSSTTIDKQEAKTKQIPSSEVSHNKGEEVATLVIPTLGQKYTVYWGTDEDSLQKGVGMFVSDLTTTPDGNGHTVLSGHRDTVFTGLDKVKEGNNLIVKYNGQIYTYEVKKTWIVDKDDRSVIVEKDKPTLTLTTCYPFHYVGSAPERYIIQAERI
ncbi:class D sortase [Priestia endophytica]|uniref:class D sortase n=1 Tax=Priestia endophytica TaxID=135735 RepID=UPI0016238DA4|nr:class D sortase [Priestia endophytica]